MGNTTSEPRMRAQSREEIPDINGYCAGYGNSFSQSLERDLIHMVPIGLLGFAQLVCSPILPFVVADGAAPLVAILPLSAPEVVAAFVSFIMYECLPVCLCSALPPIVFFCFISQWCVCERVFLFYLCFLCVNN